MIEIRNEEQSGPDWARRAYEVFDYDSIRQLESLYRWLLRLLQVEPARSLLDAACGKSQLVRMASEMGLDACGVDYAHTALRVARRAGPGAYVTADAERLPFPDNHFDYVTSVGSLEHYMDMERGTRELARILHPAGRALVLLPNTFSLLCNVYYAFKTGLPINEGQPLQRYASRRQWEQLLETNGLRIRRAVKYEREWPASLADLLWYLHHLQPLVHLLLSPFVPLNLANCFVFLCEKITSEETPM